MITPISLQQLCRRFGGDVVNGDYRFKQVSTDSRKECTGSLFVALQGENFDGHEYLSQAIDQGAGALVIAQSKLPALKEQNLPIWAVDDTCLALGYIAQQQRDNFSGKVVAITGSSGKTTVKGMLSQIFSKVVGDDNYIATKGNFNNHIGVPLTLFDLKAQHQFAAIEMGASALGEIDYLTTLAKPHVAMINNVMAAHLEGFGSIDQIANAKGEIYKGLVDGGIAIVNLDDQYAAQWLAQNQQRECLTFSAKGNLEAHISASEVLLGQQNCYRFVLNYGSQKYPVQLSVLGLHSVANALAAATCAYALKLEGSKVSQALSAFSGEAGRIKVLKGTNEVTLIDDTYNANPGSVKAAIDVLMSTQGHKILVLGDMAELGDEAESQHKMIGEYAKEKGVHALYCLGNLTPCSVAAFGSEGQHFTSFESLVAALSKWLSSETTILIKGSRSSHMEEVIALLATRGDKH